MDVRIRKDKPQKFGSGNLFVSCGDYYMVVHDLDSGELRLVSVENGNMLYERYNSWDELYKLNGDLEPLSHAEIVVSEF